MQICPLNNHFISLWLSHMRKLLGMQNIRLKLSVFYTSVYDPCWYGILKMSFMENQHDFLWLVGSKPGLTPSPSSQVWQACQFHCQDMNLHNYSVQPALVSHKGEGLQQITASRISAVRENKQVISLGWESPSSQLYWLLRHSPCPPSTQVSPEAEPEPILVQLVMESLLMHHLEDGKGFALLFATVFPGPGTAPGV